MKSNEEETMQKRHLYAASSKWNKWKKVKEGGLGDAQPATIPYSRPALLRFLRCYRTVFLKPDRGYGGSGVLSIQKRARQYQVIEQSRSRLFSNEKNCLHGSISIGEADPSLFSKELICSGSMVRLLISVRSSKKRSRGPGK